MEVTIKKYVIDGKKYISVRDMSILVNRSSQTIYNLVGRGNKIRKMKGIRLGKQLLILYSEVTDFPFTLSGRRVEEKVYHYTTDGKVKAGQTGKLEDGICK